MPALTSVIDGIALRHRRLACVIGSHADIGVRVSPAREEPHDGGDVCRCGKSCMAMTEVIAFPHRTRQ